MQFDKYNLTINSALLPYLVNGDDSGIEEWEANDCDALCRQWPNAVFDYGDAEPHFARCDILGEHGECVDVTVWVPVEGEA